MPSTFVLTTPVTSGDPGQAAWTNTNALPGGVKSAELTALQLQIIKQAP